MKNENGAGANSRKARAAMQKSNRVVNQHNKIEMDRHGWIRCRVCACTTVDACARGCTWIEENLCSTCYGAAYMIAIATLSWGASCRRVNMAALRREVDREMRSPMVQQAAGW